MFTNYNLQLSSREFELLARAFIYWSELVLPNRQNNETVKDINDLLKQFWFEYEMRPF